MTDSVAIAHGQLTGDGGAERVAIELARTFDAPIYSPAVDEEYVPDDVTAHQILTDRGASLWTSRGRIPDVLYWIGKHLYVMQRMSWIEDLYDHDVVIESKPTMSWFVQRDEQTVVRYLHHTYRRHYDQFFKNGKAAKKRAWSTFFRGISRQTADYPHLIVCNSDLTAQRARDHWAVRDERLAICYPPVDTATFGAEHDTYDEDYYLCLGRLAINKELPEVVEAFQERGDELWIAGGGSQRERLEEMAAGHENIRLLGYVDGGVKRELLASAQALVMNARNEDFGIVPIEAMASGTPVIGVNEPFTNKQILDGYNGLTYERGVRGLTDAIDRFGQGGVAWGAPELERFADRFSRERFQSRMHDMVDLACERARITTPWGDASTERESIESEAYTLADGGEKR